MQAQAVLLDILQLAVIGMMIILVIILAWMWSATGRVLMIMLMMTIIVAQLIVMG